MSDSPRATLATLTSLSGTFLPTGPGLRFTWTAHMLGTDLVLRAQVCTVALSGGAHFADGTTRAIAHTAARSGVGTVPPVIVPADADDPQVSVTTTYLSVDGVVTGTVTKAIPLD